MQVMIDETKKVSASRISSENTYSHVAGKQRNVSTSYNAMDIFEYRTDSDTNLLGVKTGRDQGTTMEEIQSFASVFDVGTYQDKMAIMSNSVSEEDLGKMYELGFSASSTDVEEYVTVMDQIKLTEAKAGKVIAGYNDDLSKEMITEACGNASVAAVIKNELKKAGLKDSKELEKKIAQTVSQAAELENPKEATKKYMVENGMEPTIENLFTAQFSGSIAGKGVESYYTNDYGYLQKMERTASTALYEKEAEQILRKNGIPSTEEAIANARWLMSEGIPVTQKTVELAGRIDQIEIPETKEELIEKIVRGILEGKDPQETILSNQEQSTYEKLSDYEERIDSISEEAVSETLKQRFPFTLQSLEFCELLLTLKPTKDSQEENEDEGAFQDGAGSEAAKRIKEQGIDSVAAWRKLEEFRLRMTTRAGLTLIKAGVSIDTTEISKLVDSLKEIEKTEARVLFPKENEEKAIQLKREYEEANKAIEELPKMPLSMMGAAIAKKDEITLQDYYEEGNQNRLKLEQAKESYETYMTVIRADLGDHIENAFSNVPEMLTEAGMEPTEGNIRAARILGYNHLEISEESIALVREADEKLQYILNELNPAMTLEMIRNGENPMKTDIDSLIQKIDDYQDSPESEHVRFSKFLYGLDQKKGISKEEREAFLDVYRVLKRVEKTKGASIGALLSTDAEWNLENMKQASSASKKTFDYRVSDDNIEKNKFTRDVRSVSHKLSASVLEKALSEKKNLSEITLEEWKQVIKGTDQSKEEKELGRKMQEIFKEASKADEYTISKLQELNLDITPDQIIAMEGIKENRGEMYRMLAAIDRKMKQTEEKPAVEGEDLSAVFLDEIEDFPESFMAETTLEETYEKFLNGMQDTIMESIENADGYIDLRQMMVLNKQVGILRAMEKEREYEIPMLIQGELTSVHVVLRPDKEQTGTVTITTALPNGSKVGANLSLRDKQVFGFIVCDSYDETEKLQNALVNMESILAKDQIDCKGIETVYSADCNLNKIDALTAETKEASNNDLYRVARAFLLSL